MGLVKYWIKILMKDTLGSGHSIMLYFCKFFPLSIQILRRGFSTCKNSVEEKATFSECRG